MSTTTPNPGSANPPPAVPNPTPAPAPTPVPIPGPDLVARTTLGLRPADYPLRGYHLEGSVTADQVELAAAEMDREGLALDTITGVDWLAEKQMEVVYDFFHPTTGLRVVIRCRVNRQNPQIPSIASIFPGANWHERETHDFFGIRFLGHPNLEPFLLPEDATYHPLRKDYTA